MQDEMIANLEFKANQKLLEQLQKQQADHNSRVTREQLDQLHQEVVQSQRANMEHWEQRSRETRETNQMMSHQLQMQMEELKTQKEQDYIKEKFAEVRREQER